MAENDNRIVEVRQETTCTPKTYVYADGREVTINYGPRETTTPNWQYQRVANAASQTGWVLLLLLALAGCDYVPTPSVEIYPPSYSAAEADGSSEATIVCPLCSLRSKRTEIDMRPSPSFPTVYTYECPKRHETKTDARHRLIKSR